MTDRPTDTTPTPVTCPRAIPPLRFCMDCPEGDKCQLPRSHATPPSDTTPSSAADVERDLLKATNEAAWFLRAQGGKEFATAMADAVNAALATIRTAAPDDGLREVQQARRKALTERLLTVADLCCANPLPGELGDVAYDLLREAAAQIASDRLLFAALKATPTPSDDLVEVLKQAHSTMKGVSKLAREWGYGGLADDLTKTVNRARKALQRHEANNGKGGE